MEHDVLFHILPNLYRMGSGDRQCCCLEGLETEVTLRNVLRVTIEAIFLQHWQNGVLVAQFTWLVAARRLRDCHE